MLARTEDLFSLCEKYCTPRFSSFLDGGEIAVLEDNFITGGADTMLWGGFEGAERRILGVFPEWSEPEAAEFPITALYIKNNGSRELSHRDFLGTLMSLGIDRSKTGDIVTDEGGAYIFLSSDIADYAAQNITKIASCGVSVRRAEPDEIKNVSKKMQSMELVCASLRLDALCAAAAGISRQAASRLISGGMVKLNHRPVTDGSKAVCEGDLLSLRGYGRFILSRCGAMTRKGRIHITVNKFI